MRAVVLEEYGGVEVLGLKEVPSPEPGPEEVLVDVVSTAVNRADLLQRMGLYPGPPMAHEIPGLEFAGVVAAVGERVSAVTVGQPVMGIVGGGSYAEQLVTHERTVVEVPEELDLVDAGAVPEVFITAFDALVAQGGLTTGRTALVHAGASGVGTAALQICSAIGAQVVTTASAGKLDACRSLGATVAVDRAEGDFVAAVREMTDGRGVDVVLDVVGGDYLDRNIDALATDGTIVQVGVMGGGKTGINLGKLLMKRGVLRGTTLRSRPIEQKIQISRRFATEVLPHFRTGALKPVIDRRYRLDEIAEAHTYMASNANVGKIAIDVVDPSDVGRT